MKYALSLLAVLGLNLATVAFAETSVSNKTAAAAGKLETMTPEQRIDALIDAKLKEKGIKPNAPIEDDTFIRRAYVSIVGRIPTIEEAERFHASTYPNKREQLIDQLLNSEGYVSHFYNYWADILRINRALGNGAQDAEYAYQLWLKEALSENTPYDKFVYELVRARGEIWENGATGYYQRDRGMPLDNMSNTVRVFLGTRLECAQCHNHPFDKWTQMDYFKMAAFSHGMDSRGYTSENRTAIREKIYEQRVQKYDETVNLKGFPRVYREEDLDRYIAREKERDSFEKRLQQWKMSEKEFRARAQKGIAAVADIAKLERTMRDAEQELNRPIRYVSTQENYSRPLKLPHDYQYTDAAPGDAVSPATMFGAEIDVENLDEGMIDAYAAWMANPENPTFTRVISNRLWKKVFGLGIIEPVDELTEMTAPSDPELMAYLEELMRESDYDMKSFLKVLYNTKAWQRAADANELVLGEPYYFQGPILQRMSAEQIWDSMVALSLPEADSYRPSLKNQLSSINRSRLIFESLSELSPDEYLAMTQEVGEVIAKSQPKEERLREEIYKAREAENTELYQKKREELRDLEREVNRKVSEIGYVKLHQSASGEQLLAAMGMNEMSMSSMNSSDGDNAGSGLVLTKLPKPEFPDPPADLDKTALKKWKEQQSADYKVYTSLVAQMARASELPSPAPRGHFLREFGQSDREVIENASDNASVPQALNLLNGPMVEALTNKFAVFGNRLHSAGDPDEKTRMIFQAMLTREPNERELELARAEIEKHGDEAYEAIVWALLNTQQFIFLQ